MILDNTAFSTKPYKGVVRRMLHLTAIFHLPLMGGLLQSTGMQKEIESGLEVPEI